MKFGTLVRNVMAPRKQPVPPALKRNDRRVAALARSEILAKAAEDMAIIREKRRTIADSFYDMGEAFTRLRSRPVLKALGVNFSGLCERLGVSSSTASRLIEVVKHVKRDDALRWGPDKSRAVLDVARALAGRAAEFAVDKPTIVKALPKGVTLESVSPRTLEAVAEKVRHAKQSSVPTGRGRTTTPAERARATALTSAAHKAGFHRVVVEAKATKPGQPADFTFRGVPSDNASAALSALSKAART